MKTGKLNLEDRQSWQKFQHILTSFASDHIDLVAPERTRFEFEQQSLSLTFTLIKANTERDYVNQFTHSLEEFLGRLQLIGVRQVELNFVAANTVETVPLLQHRFALTYIAANAITAGSRSISNSSSKSLVRGDRPAKIRRIPGSALVASARNWLVNPQTRQNLRHAGRLSIFDPKGFLLELGSSAKEKFVATINWVDTFPWESWKNSIVEAQKRRHARNLAKALIEDFLILAVLTMSLLWGMNAISFASVDVATMPAAHFDTSVGEQKYRCGILPGVNKRNYICLGRNMSYKQVASILGGEGKPLGLDPQYGKSTVIVSWKTWNGGSLNATFADDRLVARAYQNI